MESWREVARDSKANGRGPVLLKEWLGILWLSENMQEYKKMPTA